MSLPQAGGSVPADRMYTVDHEWVRQGDDGTSVIGITAYAAKALGDVVYVELPEIGAILVEGTSCGEIESTKSVSDLMSPGRGEVVAINHEVIDEPGLVNSDPYSLGWLIAVRLSETHDLLEPIQYVELTKESS